MRAPTTARRRAGRRRASGEGLRAGGPRDARRGRRAGFGDRVERRRDAEQPAADAHQHAARLAARAAQTLTPAGSAAGTSAARERASALSRRAALAEPHAVRRSGPSRTACASTVELRARRSLRAAGRGLRGVSASRPRLHVDRVGVPPQQLDRPARRSRARCSTRAVAAERERDPARPRCRAAAAGRGRARARPRRAGRGRAARILRRGAASARRQRRSHAARSPVGGARGRPERASPVASLEAAEGA